LARRLHRIPFRLRWGTYHCMPHTQRFQKHFPTAHSTGHSFHNPPANLRRALNTAPVSIATATASASRRGAYLGRPTATTCLPDAPATWACPNCLRPRSRRPHSPLRPRRDASSFCSTPDPSLQRAPAPWYSSWHAAYHSVAHSCRHLPRVPQRRSTFRTLLWRSRATWQRAATS
jgi:hypothetical protein